MAVHAKTVEIEARVDLSLWVRRGEAGGVTEGVRSVIGDVEGVTALEIREVTGVRPLANELRIDAAVTVTVRVERTFESRAIAVEQRIDDGFGVTDVAQVDLVH